MNVYRNGWGIYTVLYCTSVMYTHSTQSLLYDTQNNVETYSKNMIQKNCKVIKNISGIKMQNNNDAHCVCMVYI